MVDRHLDLPSPVYGCSNIYFFEINVFNNTKNGNTANNKVLPFLITKIQLFVYFQEKPNNNRR